MAKKTLALTDKSDNLPSLPIDAHYILSLFNHLIHNGDPLPLLSIADLSVAEGNSGSSNATLTVSLSAASKDTVTVNYTSSDGSAAAGSDYLGISGKLSFAPGETSKTIAVPVIGDTTPESNETLKITLASPSNAHLKPDAASATLTLNDDDQVIDLGPDYGKLILPVSVDGHLYYYWDRSGDGTTAGTKGAGYTNSQDTTDHDTLDKIFTQDIHGKTGGNGDTDNIYRYATINGVHLALPTAGDGGGFVNSSYYAPGTATGGNPASNGSTAINSIYNDLLAVWDAYNGTGTGGRSEGSNGTPPGWNNYDTSYWSATPSATAHASISLVSGYVGYNFVDSDYYSVALEVL
jgi:hypothetical protein